MTEVKKILRLAKIAKEFNVGAHTIVELLQTKGFEVIYNPGLKLTEEMYDVLLGEYQGDIVAKEKADNVKLGVGEHEDIVIDSSTLTSSKKEKDNDEVLIQTSGAQIKNKEESSQAKVEVTKTEKVKLTGPKVLGKVEIKKPVKKEVKKIEEEEPVSPEKKEDKAEMIKTEKVNIEGPKVLGKIDLPKEPTPKEKPEAEEEKQQPTDKKRKRKRIVKPAKISLKDGKGETRGTGSKFGRKTEIEPQVSEKEIEDKIKATLSKLEGTSKGKGSKAKIKRQKKEEAAAIQEQEEAVDNSVLDLTEFISVSELASLMNVAATEVISKCMELGIMVSINQRLDAEVIELVADEFGFTVKFIDISDQDEVLEEEADNPEDLIDRAPIVTVMGHVDHGKTSLLDFIRNANVIGGEAGGITQHIGAYEVTADNGKKVVFLDTPGHEAFTAMRARGAKVTDVAVIVVAADDNIMPQTKEAISHAQAAGVPMIFAINKIDKEGANPEKIKEQLAGMNILVEDWGGKYQSQDISAKQGTSIDKLLEKITLEAEILELKANPNKSAMGTVIEASLDKGRGYVATMLVQNGTLKVGDIMACGPYFGKVKAMFNEKGKKRDKAEPPSAVLILGLNGAPQAGEIFKVYESDQEAKQVTNKRDQIIREQGLRTQKHITLDEIGRRLALGTFKELNVIVKADVDGSAEALSDSLQKLSTEEIVVNIVHKAVGQIIESDVLLASASDAIIIGFQVRPSVAARQLAEKENIEIRMYSVIYKAIEEITTAMEGMLEPTIEEKITGNLEVKDIFKISRTGTIAGCQVIEGKIANQSMVRVVRDGIVVYTGKIDTLKRFKDDVKEVISGQECGIHVKDFNDVKVGDIIECYKEKEIKRTL